MRPKGIPEGMQTQERTINGCHYTSTPLPADRGLSVSIRLVKVIGAGVVDLIKTQQDGVDVEALAGEAIQKIAAKLDDAGVVTVVRDLLSCTTRTDRHLGAKHDLGNAADFNLAFAANYMELIEAVAFAIEVNRFFGSGEGIIEVISRIMDRFGVSTSPESRSASSEE